MAPLPEVPPKLLTHFTTIPGLLGIIENNEFWVSNVSFLNDRAELVHGISVAEKVLVAEFLAQEAVKGAGVRDRILSVIEDLKISKLPNTYAACFCKRDDLLSQWRGYGGREQGVSITLKGSWLRQLAEDNGGRLIEVIYDRERAAQRFKKVIDSEVFDWEIEDLIGQEPSPTFTEAFIKKVAELAPRFKDDGFQEENEWRIVIQRDDESAPLRFRVNDGVIVPYLTVRSREPLPIDHVIVGPGKNQDLCIKSLQMFLKAKGFSDVAVVPSKVPYRN
jgi:hypothetical protein